MRSARQLAGSLRSRLLDRAHSGALGLGLVGIGGWGASNARYVMRSGRFDILGVHDVQSQCGREFANRYGTVFHPELAGLLEDSRIEAVVLTVPTYANSEVVKAIADSGKHVFVEKPLASRPSGCREIGRYCRSRGLVLQVGYQMRRDPVFREIRRLLDGGGLGRPFYARGAFTLDRRSRDDWRNDGNLCPGGSMEQLGAHLIDVLIYLFGHPEQARGRAEGGPGCSEPLDWARVTLSFGQDLHASVLTSFSSPKYVRLEIFFEGGNLATDGDRLWTRRGDLRVEKRKPRGVCGRLAQFVEFADCVELGRTPETGAEEAAAVMDIVSLVQGAKPTLPDD